mmetsp:Transcript_67257/g.119782  ORF Transcript_67257/g.119782 Transcript_67257/m.119782 type:complete len:368 (-) Transcript_67257:60-1163(-)
MPPKVLQEGSGRKGKGKGYSGSRAWSTALKSAQCPHEEGCHLSPASDKGSPARTEQADNEDVAAAEGVSLAVPTVLQEPISTRSSVKKVVPGPISGLTLTQICPRTTRAALAELRPHFKPNSQKFSSSMFEVGWSFHAIEQEGVMRTVHQLEEFPHLRALLTEATTAFCSDDALFEERINVICRRYRRGEELKKHIDRPQLFDENVYGCILHNTSDRVLEFQQSTRSGEVTAGPHRVREEPGTCFCQTGDARYNWIHGVEPLGEGERISVTWRWIEEGAATRGHQAAQTKGSGKNTSSQSGRSAESHGKGPGRQGHSKGEGQSASQATRALVSNQDGKQDQPHTVEASKGESAPRSEAPRAKRWGRR